MNEPEKENYPPIPLSEFTEDKLRILQRMNMLSTIQVYELECHQVTPDLKAIEHFLRVRYNYWMDDIDHVDPFIYSDN